MIWPFKKKKPLILSYQFLCRTCDIFFERKDLHKNKCPGCGRVAEIYSIKEKKD